MRNIILATVVTGAIATSLAYAGQPTGAAALVNFQAFQAWVKAAPVASHPSMSDYLPCDVHAPNWWLAPKCKALYAHRNGPSSERDDHGSTGDHDGGNGGKK